MVTQWRHIRVEVRLALESPRATPTDFVFHAPSKIAEIVRKDAAYAGLIPQKSPTRKRVDFHCLRKSCARILIEMKVHPKVIQQVLRHSDIRLTMHLCGELGEDHLFREVPEVFPVPRMFAASTAGSPVDAERSLVALAS